MGQGTFRAEGGQPLALSAQTIPNFVLRGVGTGPYTISHSLVTSSAGCCDAVMGDAAGTPTTTTVLPGATLDLADQFTQYINGGHRLVNRGTGTWSAGNVCLDDGARFINKGTFAMSANNYTMGPCAGTAPTAVVNEAGATMRTVDNSTMFIAAPFTDKGTVDLPVGILRLYGAIALPGSSTLRFKITGTTVGTEFGQLQVGSVELGGTLAIRTPSTFHPKKGQSYAIITGTPTGTFAHVTGRLLPGGLKYAVKKSTSGVSLEVVKRHP
jgi:hypothetical protein